MNTTAQSQTKHNGQERHRTGDRSKQNADKPALRDGRSRTDERDHLLLEGHVCQQRRVKLLVGRSLRLPHDRHRFLRHLHHSQTQPCDEGLGSGTGLEGLSDNGRCYV